MFGFSLVVAAALPAQLAAHVQAGQTLLYTTQVRASGSFGHSMRALSRVRILDAQGAPVRWYVVASMPGKPASAPDMYSFDGASDIRNATGQEEPGGGFFFYNLAYYGTPPASLAPGAQWSFSTDVFTDLGPPGRGTLRVIGIRGHEVDLSLQFHGTGAKNLPALPRMPSGQMHETTAVSGTLVFMNGILQREQLQSRDEQQYGNQPSELFFSNVTTVLNQ